MAPYFTTQHDLTDHICVIVSLTRNDAEFTFGVHSLTLCHLLHIWSANQRAVDWIIYFVRRCRISLSARRYTHRAAELTYQSAAELASLY